MDKGLFFFILSLLCFWVVLDEIYGHKLISQFVIAIIPSAKED